MAYNYGFVLDRDRIGERWGRTGVPEFLKNTEMPSSPTFVWMLLFYGAITALKYTSCWFKSERNKNR